MTYNFLWVTTWAARHLPIEISIDAQPRNIHTNPIGYKFDQTDREVFESTLEAALSSGDVPELNSTQDIDKHADFIVTAISTAVGKAIPTSKSGLPESQPVLEESLALIKEKRRPKRQYSQAHDLLVKTRINQLQKEIKDNLRIESQTSWEKFCNDISLETNHTESWRTIKNFLKPKGQRDYRALRLDVKTAKTNADKAQIFAESVERHFGIQSDNFDSNHFDEVNQFIEDNYEFFILLMITDRTWMMMLMITDLTWMPGGGGGHSITKHTRGWLEGLSQKAQNISPKIAILKNAKIIPPKYS